MRKTHGQTKSPEYMAWKGMKRRCLCPSNKSYRYYGGRGIRIHERYLKFENFYADLGPRPNGCWLDRIDNSKGYEPGNLRWTTPREQMLNRRGWGKTIKGTRREKNGRWVAQAFGKYIGTFNTEKEAAEAYKKFVLSGIAPRKMTNSERAKRAASSRWLK